MNAAVLGYKFKDRRLLSARHKARCTLAKTLGRGLVRSCYGSLAFGDAGKKSQVTKL